IIAGQTPHAKAVNESDTPELMEWLERQMRSFMNRVAFFIPESDGRRPLNAGPAVEKGICREAAGHAKALKLISASQKEVSEN
ncbi:hypothetical protein TNCV_2721621, partial [Trichonephila clavipes]